MARCAMRRRILVAEDNALVRRKVRILLEPDQELEICAEAHNGVEAVRKARKYQPDLVLIDLFMPEMSGLVAIREIRKASPHLRVVAFTLHDSDAIRDESQRAGADALVAKANCGVELLPRIRELLNLGPAAA